MPRSIPRVPDFVLGLRLLSLAHGANAATLRSPPRTCVWQGARISRIDPITAPPIDQTRASTCVACAESYRPDTGPTGNRLVAACRRSDDMAGRVNGHRRARFQQQHSYAGSPSSSRHFSHALCLLTPSGVAISAHETSPARATLTSLSSMSSSNCRTNATSSKADAAARPV